MNAPMVECWLCGTVFRTDIPAGACPLCAEVLSSARHALVVAS